MMCATSLGVRAADVPAHPTVFFDPDAPPATFAPSFPKVQSAPVFVEPPPKMFDWSGVNIGLNAGLGFNSKTAAVFAGTDAATVAGLQGGSVPSQFSTTASGLVGGLQIGFTKELDPMLIPPLAKFGAAIVLGLEADADYTDLSSFSNFEGGGGATTLHGRNEFLGTARGRIGIAFDRLLIYGTGGFAYGGFDSAAHIGLASGVSFLGSGSSLNTGYVYGGGVAYAFPATPLFKLFMAPAVTVKLEYLHYNLDSSNFAATNVGPLGDAYNVQARNNGDIVRAGVDYKFDLKIPPPPY